jgi:hypothetical protein
MEEFPSPCFIEGDGEEVVAAVRFMMSGYPFVDMIFIVDLALGGSGVMKP